MTEAEKLEALVQKAIESGWSKLNQMIPYSFRNYVKDQRVVKIGANDDGMVGSEYFNVEAIIFNKDFARALFGESPQMCINGKIPATDRCCGITAEGFDCEPLEAWQYQLQQAVIAENSIDYMYGAVFHE